MQINWDMIRLLVDGPCSSLSHTPFPLLHPLSNTHTYTHPLSPSLPLTHTHTHTQEKHKVESIFTIIIPEGQVLRQPLVRDRVGVGQCLLMLHWGQQPLNHVNQTLSASNVQGSVSAVIRGIHRCSSHHQASDQQKLSCGNSKVQRGLVQVVCDIDGIMVWR